jgi:hypothetical protein
MTASSPTERFSSLSKAEADADAGANAAMVRKRLLIFKYVQHQKEKQQQQKNEWKAETYGDRSYQEEINKYHWEGDAEGDKTDDTKRLDQCVFPFAQFRCFFFFFLWCWIRRCC